MQGAGRLHTLMSLCRVERGFVLPFREALPFEPKDSDSPLPLLLWYHVSVMPQANTQRMVVSAVEWNRIFEL